MYAAKTQKASQAQLSDVNAHTSFFLILPVGFQSLTIQSRLQSLKSYKGKYVIITQLNISVSDRDIAAAQVQPGNLASPHVCPQSLCASKLENSKNVPVDLFHLYIL